MTSPRPHAEFAARQSVTDEQRQEYAECVGLLYPRDDVIGPAAVGLLLIIVLLGAISGAFGARGHGLMPMAVMGFIWAGIFTSVATFVWLIWQAIKYALGVTG